MYKLDMHAFMCIQTRPKKYEYKAFKNFHVLVQNDKSNSS